MLAKIAKIAKIRSKQYEYRRQLDSVLNLLGVNRDGNSGVGYSQARFVAFVLLYSFHVCKNILFLTMLQEGNVHVLAIRLYLGDIGSVENNVRL